MNYVVSKEQYDKVVFKLLYSLFGKLTYLKTEERGYIEIFDKYGNNFSDIWLDDDGSAITKGCKNELSLRYSESYEIFRFFPVVKKKRFAKLLALYVEKNTGIKIDCVNYATDFIKAKDDYGDDILNHSSIIYSTKKKKFK
jgi:hypothetical protein